MELRALKYFVTIAREGSLTRASKRLGASQPALSTALKQFEDEIGTPLFVRGRDGVRLTPAGADLVRYAERVLAEADEFVRRSRELAGEMSAVLVLACNPSLGSYFLPSFLPGFMAGYPDIELRLWNGTSPEVRDAVLGGQADFGLIVNTVEHPDLVILPAFADVIEVFGLEPAPDLAAAADALRARPLLHIPRPPFDAMLARLAEAGASPDRRIECGDLELTRSLCLAGVGPALLPRRVAGYGDGRRLRPIHEDLPKFHDTIHLVFRPETSRTRAAQAVKDALLAHGRDLDRAGPTA